MDVNKEKDVVLPFDCFSSWIHCICVVTFDLELGQAMELIYPKNAVLSETEKMNINYLSFPDSNTGCMGDVQYHFRIRLSSKSMAHHKLRQISQQKSLNQFQRDSPPYLKPQAGYAFGYVYFRQVKDASIRRGYFQKSVVIISPWPFIRLFNHVNSIIAPEFFSIGPEILEAVCHDIDQWPAPQMTSSSSSSWLQLPLLGHVIQCKLSPTAPPPVVLRPPSRAISTAQNSSIVSSSSSFFKNFTSKLNPSGGGGGGGGGTTTSAAGSTTTGSNIIEGTNSPSLSDDDNDEDDNDEDDDIDSSSSSYPPGMEKEFKEDNSWVKISSDTQHILNSVHEVNYFHALHPVLHHLQVLWELMITCQPILIIACSPKQSCELVQALTQVIQPMPYCCDYRPYFTIHDSDFKEYTTRVQAPPSVVLGVTNPFFVKSLSHWPHIIRLTDDVNVAIPFFETGNYENRRAIKNDKLKSVGKSLPSSLVATLAGRGGGGTNNLDVRPGLYSRHKPFLTIDKSLFKKIKKGINRNRHSELQSVLIRQFCAELTHSFMIPLERYVSGLMPLQKFISPFRKAPTMGRFQLEEFLSTIPQSGPQLTSGIKGDWEGLYRRFVTTPLFAYWLAERQNEVNEKLQSIQITALCQLNLSAWCVDKAEVQLVDILMNINSLLKSARCGDVQLSNDQEIRLREHLETILFALPPDLQTVLRHNNSIATALANSSHVFT